MDGICHVLLNIAYPYIYTLTKELLVQIQYTKEEKPLAVFQLVIATLSFYQIPKEKKLEKKWLHWIGRSGFIPNKYHRVCSKHFVGGKKTCLNNTPCLVQKLLMPKQPNPRTTSKCRDRKAIPKRKTDEIQGESKLKDVRILELEQLVKKLKQEKEEQQEEILELKKKVEQYDMERQLEKEKCGQKRILTPEEELFLCLARLRLGLLEKNLSDGFYVSISQEYVRSTMPENIKDNYPKTRVIVDCTELFIDTPSQPRSQSATFSTYKNHNTELYAGNTSDKQLTQDCGTLDLLEEGDEIMADRGFEIEDCLPHGVSLNIPPFLGDQLQFCQADEVKTQRIAKHQIHVERAIQRIKTFGILKHDLPISMAADFNKIWVVCAYLTLFFRPLIREHEE
ncbi:uncharacterized protein LOC114529576 [Dendronephthya gigantea]|uniref:uncharacterized protein LOC114529576 n=1 Tax=Dendronephthya gigantea TaxID=151771 RepID=UPI00106A2980|nr:uncharacterized protein LOC114529576 [Dendronephthya gigantea]